MLQFFFKSLSVAHLLWIQVGVCASNTNVHFEYSTKPTSQLTHGSWDAFIHTTLPLWFRTNHKFHSDFEWPTYSKMPRFFDWRQLRGGRGGDRVRRSQSPLHRSSATERERKKESSEWDKGRFLPRGRWMVILQQYYDNIYSLTHLSCMGGGREIWLPNTNLLHISTGRYPALWDNAPH